GGAFLAVAIFVAQVRAGPPRDAWKPPLASFRLLAAMPDQQRVFCYDFAPCSVGLDFPVRVFMDGRADPYPPRVWYDFNTLRNAARGWRRLVEAYDINAMLVKKKDKLDRALRKSSNWRNVPTPDRCCRLYERKSP
ncbi:MAG TPA: hypothetical protein VMH02_11000, partial [Verrucomicrobiae bacterium]|nr:hypothetical protein [Verrucomicrobiae bacterium]